MSIYYFQKQKSQFQAQEEGQFLYKAVYSYTVIINNFKAYLKMSDQSKRSMRVRRAPAYLSSDVSHLFKQNQEPQNPGYARPSYTRQNVSPAQELNKTAKLLVKFINSVNKKYSQHNKNQDLIKEKQKNKVPLVQQNLKKNIQSMKQGGKKRITTRQQPKNDSRQQQKCSQDRNSHTLDKQMGKNQQINQNKVGKVDSEKKTPIINNNSGGINSRYAKIAKVLCNDNKITTQSGLQIPNPQLNTKKKSVKIEQPEPEVKFNRQKIFGRASYHIAIAYNIYLEAFLNQEGSNTIPPNFRDPNYNAKKMKEKKQQDAKNSKK